MDPRPPHVLPDVQSLDVMSKRLREGETPSQRQVEEVLERGFGKLMQLEAELQERRSAGDSVSALNELRDAIEALREALTVLRTLSSPAGPPRIGYGFVLPESPRGAG